MADRFWSRVDRTSDPDGCWLFDGAPQGAGYGCFRVVSTPGKSQLLGAHRFSWQLANGAIPKGKFILHSRNCESRMCVRPDHLRVGDRKENAADMVANGNNKGRKLNADMAREICRLNKTEGHTHRKLASLFGVAPGAIADVLNGRTWAHATGAVSSHRIGRPPKIRVYVHSQASESKSVH